MSSAAAARTTGAAGSRSTAASIAAHAPKAALPLSLRIGRRRGGPVLVVAKVVNQKARRHQKVLSVDDWNHVGTKVVQMTQGHSVEHGLVGISAQYRNGQIGKGQMQALDGKSPNVGLVGRILFGPDIQYIVRHGGIKEGHYENSHANQQRVRHQTPNRSQEPAKGVIRRPATRARVEGNPLLVFLAETGLHVHQKEQSQRKGSAVTKARQKAVDFQVGLDIVPGPHGVIRADNVEIHAQGQNDRGSEPPFGNNGELVEHILLQYKRNGNETESQ